MENNARCPVCNGEFYIDSGERAVCPHCGKEVESVRARKYFAAFRGSTATVEQHGKNYFSYEGMLGAGADSLAAGDFDKAEQCYLEATKTNPGDWRGYMGIVAARTKNYTDLKDTTHKKALKEAISVADESEKRKIAEIYKAYSVKASMTQEELGEYNAERQKDFKARIKKAIIGFAKVNDAGKKKAKNSMWIMIAMIAAGLVAIVLGFVFDLLPIVLVGIAVALCSYGLAIVVIRQRYNEKLYEVLAVIFNGLVGFGLSFDETEEILVRMSKLLTSAKDGAPTSITDRQLEELCGFADGLGNAQLIALLKGYKLTAKYWK